MMCFVGLGCPVFKIWHGFLVMRCDLFMLESCSVLMATSGLFRLVNLNGWSRAPRRGVDVKVKIILNFLG